MLVRVARAMESDRWRAHVVSMIPAGPMAVPLREAGIPVDSLELRRGAPDPRALLRLRRVTRHARPDLIQSWMYHADLLGGLVGGIERVPVVWNVRHSNLDPAVNSRSTLLTARLCAASSRRLPAAVIYCSSAARAAHEEIGYRPLLGQVLPNGFDLEQFTPTRDARAEVRAELDAGDDSLVVAIVARFHPQKDHATFARAAADLARTHDAVFVIVGRDCTPANQALVALLRDAGIAERTRLLGERHDVPRLLQGFDLLVSSSVGEGFPNSVGEAMAAGVPCVVTDVGDSALLVDGTGIVVPPGQPDALAAGMRRLADAGPDRRQELGRQARRRMEQHFSIGAVAGMYADLYETVLAGRAHTA